MTDFEALQKSALASLQNPGTATTPMPKSSNDEPPTLYLFRHCQTYDNVRRIFSGHRQSTLTPTGKKQAKELAEKLKTKHIDLFISPSLERCIQTLEPIQKYHKNIPYIIKPELIERDYGDITGKSKMTVMREHPKEAVLWRRSWNVPPPNGESLEQVWNRRMKSFCQWLQKKMKDERINVAYSGTNNTVRLIRMYFEPLTRDETLTVENAYGDYASYHLT